MKSYTTPKKTHYIVLMAHGDDCGRIVQYAYSLEQAEKLVADVMPATLPGYRYQIIEAE